VFNFKGAEEIIKKVAQKRAEEAKKIGKSKTISSDVFDRMFKNYQEVSPEEGFDKVIEEDNIEELKKVIGEIKESKLILNF
jgi:guanylate kinase